MPFGLSKSGNVSADDPRFVPVRDFIMRPAEMEAGVFLQQLQAMLEEEENPLAEQDTAIVEYAIKFLVGIARPDVSLGPEQRAMVWNTLTEVVSQGIKSPSTSRDVMAIATFINTCG